MTDEVSMRFGERVRVLIVDDEPSICRALELALTRAGFDPLVALSGDSAHTALRNEHIDVMIIDLRLQDERGDVTFRVATALQPHLRSSTIFTTGDITEKAQQIIAECDCPLLLKPFDLRELLDAVRRAAPRVRDATA